MKHAQTFIKVVFLASRTLTLLFLFVLSVLVDFTLIQLKTLAFLVQQQLMTVWNVTLIARCRKSDALYALISFSWMKDFYVKSVKLIFGFKECVTTFQDV